MTNQIQPIFILPEGTQRATGKGAQRTNIAAAKLVAETVRTTLGPKGMDKMIVDSLGDVTITNDGVTILEEMAIEHPSAKMIVEVAKTQEAEVGDGTTTAVVLAGELLNNAERLLDQEIHPTVLAKGYRMAAEKAQQILKEIAEPISINDKDLLIKIAITAMTGKGAESSKEKLADLTVAAVKKVADFENGITVPAGATKFYAYLREFNQWKNLYGDNRGTCTFTVTETDISSSISSVACTNNLEEGKNVCLVLESNLRDIIENSLNIGEDSPNKGYRVNIYYSSLNQLENNSVIISTERGIFENCTAIVGGSHSIAVSSFSSGVINVELEVCAG